MIAVNLCPYLLPCGRCTKYDCPCSEFKKKEIRAIEDRYLYRAKRIDNGEWVEGNLVWSDDADNDYKAIIIPSVNSNMFTRGGARGDLGFENWYRVDPSTICRE